jgi:hypothetical protein
MLQPPIVGLGHATVHPLGASAQAKVVPGTLRQHSSESCLVLPCGGTPHPADRLAIPHVDQLFVDTLQRQQPVLPPHSMKGLRGAAVGLEQRASLV